MMVFLSEEQHVVRGGSSSGSGANGRSASLGRTTSNERAGVLLVRCALSVLHEQVYRLCVHSRPAFPPNVSGGPVGTGSDSQAYAVPASRRAQARPAQDTSACPPSSTQPSTRSAQHPPSSIVN